MRNLVTRFTEGQNNYGKHFVLQCLYIAKGMMYSGGTDYLDEKGIVYRCLRELFLDRE